MLDYDTLIELHRMRDAGATISEISRTLNIARSTVMWNLRRQIPKPTDNSIVVRSVMNGGWSTSPVSVSYISLPRVRFLEAANDSFESAAVAA